MPDVIDALDACMPPGATLVSDTGSYNDWITRHMRFPRERRYIGTLSGARGDPVERPLPDRGADGSRSRVARRLRRSPRPRRLTPRGWQGERRPPRMLVRQRARVRGRHERGRNARGNEVRIAARLQEHDPILTVEVSGDHLAYPLDDHVRRHVARYTFGPDALQR
jgi:hypothetical protein